MSIHDDLPRQLGAAYLDTDSDNDGFSVWARKFLADNGLDSKTSSNLGNGFYQAWVWTQALIARARAS